MTELTVEHTNAIPDCTDELTLGAKSKSRMAPRGEDETIGEDSILFDYRPNRKESEERLRIPCEKATSKIEGTDSRLETIEEDSITIDYRPSRRITEAKPLNSSKRTVFNEKNVGFLPTSRNNPQVEALAEPTDCQRQQIDSTGDNAPLELSKQVDNWLKRKMESVDSSDRIDDYAEMVEANNPVFAFKYSKCFLENNEVRFCNGSFFYYELEEGRFVKLSDNAIRTQIRNLTDSNILERLTKLTVDEIMDRLRTCADIQISDFSPDPRYMNFKNGVLDLDTDELLPHSPCYAFTSCIQTDYEEEPQESVCFKKFLEVYTDGDKKKKRHLQEVIGYILSEYFTAKVIPIIIGPKDSGKSTILHLISRLLSSDVVTSVPLEKLSGDFIANNLFGMKLNIVSELPDKPIKNVELIKRISGNDAQFSQMKYSNDTYCYRSKVKMLLAGNEMFPILSNEATEAFFDRLTFIIFNHTISKKAIIIDFADKLWDEAPWITNWAIKGLQRLRKNNFVFTEPDDSIAFKKRYILTQNNVRDFVKIHCRLDPKAKVFNRDMLTAYSEYCKENGLFPLGKKTFLKEIANGGEGVEAKRVRIGSENLHGFKGIALKSDDSGDNCFF